MTQQRLLVLDDEPDFCEYVRTVAEQENFQVETIQDPRAFQALFERFDPNAIVLDLVMPEVDGFEIIRWLADKQRPLHILLATGYDPRYANMADKLAAGHSKHLKITPVAKPVRVNTLRRLLHGMRGSDDEAN